MVVWSLGNCGWPCSVIRQRPAAATFEKGYCWGYRYQCELRNLLNCRVFLPDFGSVPGSQYNQLLTSLSFQFTALFSRRQLTIRWPFRVRTPGRGSIKRLGAERPSTQVFDSVALWFFSGGVLGVFLGESACHEMRYPQRRYPAVYFAKLSFCRRGDRSDGDRQRRSHLHRIWLKPTSHWGTYRS